MEVSSRLVPKLCLGTPVRETPFRETPTDRSQSGHSVVLLVAKQSFADSRSQTEFGNEVNGMMGCKGCE